MSETTDTGRTPRTETSESSEQKDGGLMDQFASEHWVWYCPECNTDLTRGEDAIACEDPDACPNTKDWGGDACGYIVCTECHRPARERRRSR
jgi:hypothetical protein